MAKVFLRKTRETRVRSGHPWIYLSEIEKVEGEFENGDVVDVYSCKNTYLGRAFYNPKSQIALRMLTLHDEMVDADFFRRRVQAAWAWRQQFADPDSCRLIYSESDFLPGLIVDKFADVLVMQSLCLGIEKWKDVIVEALVDTVHLRGIYERNDVPVRRLEGMQQTTGLLYGEVPDRIAMKENGITFMVDVKNGQKTGFFLDQKENRAAIAPLCPGARVLDCFCHNGSFSLHAAKYGAKSVLGVDISEEALEVARENARINGLDGVATFEAHNCFDHLRELTDAKEKFDLVILDPPAFTKSRRTANNAEKGYKEINLRAMRLLPRGGYLATASCSHFMPAERFERMLRSAAADAGVELRQIEVRTQASDHPILWNVPETDYLKFYLFQVV